MDNRPTVNSLIPLLVLLLVGGLYACSGVSKPLSSPPQLKLPSTSPVKVVSGYLDALRRADFVKSYEFITVGYAGNLDKESYKINMEQSLVKRYNWSLVGYEIKGVRIIGDQAFVVTEIDVRFKPLDSKDSIRKKIEVQYLLASFGKDWKISADECISNCVASADLIGKGGISKDR